MAAREWTDDQKKVIDTRDNSILVSAAAGSGKTAVLVERIIGMVTDPKDPVDVDRLLVVTFTRAAAKEMKDRIYSTLHKRLSEDPGNTLLARQMTLVHSAHISTIDSFASDVVKSYYYVTGLDGDMHMGDEGELKLLITETMDEMLESEYDIGSKEFLNLVSSYKNKERDSRLVDIITRLHNISMSYPYPDKYLTGLLNDYEITDEKKLMDSEIVKSLIDRAGKIIGDYLDEVRDIHMALSESGHPYEAAFASDISLLEDLLACRDYISLHIKFEDLSFARLANCKEDQYLELKEVAGPFRDEMKKTLGKLSERFQKTTEEILKEIAMAKPFVSELVRLTLRFNEMYSEKKRERRLMDFSDMEHFALDILVDRNTGKATQIAESYREYFREVMVDEYQDSNMLQEYLLSAISDPHKNYFMVGDVKQSIYGFRQARPDIFTEKYKDYKDEATGQFRIDLSKNFRSRPEVLEITNDVFSEFMDETIGMVTYDERARLNCGAEYPEGEGYDSELILVPTDSDVTDEDEESIMLESRAIGQKIRELVGNLMVGGKDDRRPLTYSDIAILNRSANSYGDLICNELADMDIPCEKTGGTGYFSVIEVETSLAILSVINNPYDDIAMAAVLKSPLFDFSDEELLLIRMAGGDIGFCESIMDVPTDQLHEETATKLSGFRTFLDKFRSISEYESVDALLYRIYDETGYLSYVTALPGGEKRRRNLEKLLDMAQAYSKTSYRGIYHFVKYIEKMKKYEIDQKDPEGDPETDSVRLMTIHKSKGLEFPVVFVCGLSKGIRFDRDVFSVSDKYGFGLDIYDRENSLKINTFHKSMISYFEKEQVIGEEARVLYVAMTRAREKLIMTAALKQNDIDKILEGKPVPQKVTYNKKISAVNYLKMVLPAFLSKAHRSHIYEASPESLIIREVIREHNRPDREIFLKMAGDKDADDISRELLERSRFTYDTGSGTEWKSKYSVSMIKKQAFMEAVDGDGETMQLFAPEPELTEYVPRFMGGSGEVSTGAERGTAMHRFLECFDFKKDDLSGAIDEEIRRQVDGGFLQEDQEKLLQIARLRKFLGSDLAGRMHRASLAGELFRERTFVMGDKPRAFFEDIAGEDEVFSDDDPQVLVQGIIDAYFIEDGKVFLIDYKTDRVDTKEELLTRYRKQMLLYQDVLNRTLHLEPGGAYMYSFALESLVEV